MIVSLHPLTLLIETLEQLESKEAPARLYQIAVACSDNFALCLQAYRQISSVDSAGNAIRLCHTQLLRLHQKLESFYRDSRIEDRMALIALEDLLERIEYLFKSYIDPTTSLPSHYRNRIHAYVYINMPNILERLGKKNIPQVYLHEILSAMDSLFENGKMPYIQYRHQDYLIQLLESLRQLAQDKRQDKHWYYRFLVVMVNFNFNHMGFFNRWKEQYISDPSFMDTLLRFPKHFSCIPNFAYDSNRRSLLELMCEYLQAEDTLPRTTLHPHPQQFIHSNFNGKELKIWMHVAVKANIMRSSEKKEVAEEFSKLVKTREGTLLSAHSLTRMDKSTEYHAALRIRKVLNTMLAELNEQFPELSK